MVSFQLSPVAAPSSLKDQAYRAIKQAILRVAIYNNPTRVGVNIDPQTVIRLAEVPNIVADKRPLPDMDPSRLQQIDALMTELGVKEKYGVKR